MTVKKFPIILRKKRIVPGKLFSDLLKKITKYNVQNYKPNGIHAIMQYHRGQSGGGFSPLSVKFCHFLAEYFFACL
jgi:hypothetical protein